MKIRINPAYDKEVNGTYPLDIYCHHENWQVKFYSGERVELGTKPGQWDQENQAFVLNKVNLVFKQRAAKIIELKQMLEKIARDCELNGIRLTKEILKDEFNKLRGKQPKRRTEGQAVVSGNSFYEWIDRYVETQRGIKAEGWLDKSKQVRQHLLNYAPKLPLSKITIGFFQGYLQYLTTEVGITDNTVKHHVNYLRIVLKYAEIHGANVPKDYLLFKHKRHEADRTWLTWDELMLLWKYKPKHAGQQRSLDVFLFCCFTGLRYQDVAGLKPENIRGDVVRFTQIKTKSRNEVALSEWAKELINKYKGAAYCFPVISNFQTSQHMKEICKEVGLDQPVQRVRYRGSERMEESLPKWQTVSMHTSRHTFACLSLERGMDVVSLSKIMGHKSINTTMQYLRMLDKSLHDKLRDVWKR